MLPYFVVFLLFSFKTFLKYQYHSQIHCSSLSVIMSAHFNLIQMKPFSRWIRRFLAVYIKSKELRAAWRKRDGAALSSAAFIYILWALSCLVLCGKIMFIFQVSDEDLRCSWGQLQKCPAHCTLRSEFRKECKGGGVTLLHSCIYFDNNHNARHNDSVPYLEN